MPLIPECIEFKNDLAVHEIESDVEISIISQRPRALSVRDEFLKRYPKKSVGQLHDLLEDGNFIIMATISEIVDEKLWWYTARPCLRAVNFERGYPFRTECNRIVYDMSPRYKLKVLATDGDYAAHFIMFDAECALLLNKSCQELQDQQEDPSSHAYPEEIFNLVGRKLLFRVEVNGDCNSSFDDSFKVRRVCSDSSIMTEYKECVDDETPLKLKFAPLFTKIEQEEGSKCVMDLSPQCKSLLTDAETTPFSCGKSSSAGHPSSSGAKRDVEELVGETWELNKRERLKGVKIEGD